MSPRHSLLPAHCTAASTRVLSKELSVKSFSSPSAPEERPFTSSQGSPLRTVQLESENSFWQSDDNTAAFTHHLPVFQVKGWGPKSSVCPSKPGKPNFLGGMSWDFAGIPPGTKPIHAEKIIGELIFVRVHAGPVFVSAGIQEYIFQELFLKYVFAPWPPASK